MKKILMMSLLAFCACQSPDMGPLSDLNQAATLQVPEQFPSIQAAVDAASPGDIIRIADGEYFEEVNISAPLTVTAEHENQVHLNGHVHLTAGADGARLENLDLTGEGEGSGVWIEGARVQLSNLHASGFRIGIKVALPGSSGSTMDSCTLDGNKLGLLVTAAGHARMTNSLILSSSDAGARVTASASASFANLTVAGCVHEGMWIDGQADLKNSILVDNDIGVSCPGACDEDYNLLWNNNVNYDRTEAGQNDLNSDPAFVNAANDDYHLRSESPAKDAGLESAAAEFDMEGRARPQGDGVDLGAYELPAERLELVVSEVMANPLDEATGEYIEIFNAGSSDVDVSGLLVSDGDAMDTIEGFQGGDTLIPAGGFGLVLDRDYAGQYAIAPGTTLLSVGTGAIGNGLASNDPIALYAPDGTLIDSFSYPFNPGNGTSVELSDLAGGDLQQDWIACPCGASPGTDGCEEELLPEDFENLVINEVMANPLDEATGEYIEIFNAGSSDVDVSGLLVSDGDAMDTIEGFQGGDTLIPAGGFGLVLDRDYAGQYAIAPGTTLLSVGTGAIGNGLASNDPIALYAPDGTLIDSFSYPFNPGNGISVEKMDPSGGDLESNWIASPCDENNEDLNTGSSPGGVNCSLVSDDFYGLEDEALIQALYSQVEGHDGLGYTEARQVMFSQIDNHDGQVECVYTGFTMTTSTIPDPGIMNTEHTWAQSWGADTWPARTDLHHLFPTTNSSNSIRGSLEFGDVIYPDWQYGGSKRGMDAQGKQVFEPRDEQKGDTARAVFYFSVRYQMDIPDKMEQDLKNWNHSDPPDQKEKERNNAIDAIQHNRNPFVDHPELVDRIADF